MRFLSWATLALVAVLAACQAGPAGPVATENGGGSVSPAAGPIVWKGYTWIVTANASAVVDGNGNLVITRDAPGEIGVQIPAFDPTVNASGTPWMVFSYEDNGTAYQGYDLFINYNSAAARISGGSLFSCEGLGYERYGVPAQEDFFFAEDCGTFPRPAGPHTLYVGERADGTMDAIFDGSWWKGTFLKDNGQAPFAYTQVYLRVRGGAVNDSFTFTDFRAGDNHPGGGNKDACTGGGWSASGQWPNQGQCIQYANTGDNKSQEISGS